MSEDPSTHALGLYVYQGSIPLDRESTQIRDLDATDQLYSIAINR